MSEKIIKFALVRYFDDESKKKYVVPVEKIKNFVIREKYDDYPFFIMRKNDCNDEEMEVPAQILTIGESEQELEKNSQDKRFIFKKQRVSDVIEMIIQRDNDDIEECNDDDKVMPQVRQNKCKKVVNKINIVNDTYKEIMDEKLAALNVEGIVFEKMQDTTDERLVENKIEMEAKIRALQTKLDDIKEQNKSLSQEVIKLNENKKELKEKNKKIEQQNEFFAQQVILLRMEVRRLKTVKRNLFPAGSVQPKSPEPKRMRMEDSPNNLGKFPEDKDECPEENFEVRASTSTTSSINNSVKVKSLQNGDCEKPKKKDKKLKKKKGSKNKKSKKDKRKDDTQEFDESATHPNLSTWYDDKDGVEIKMKHLYYGISVNYAAWKEMMDSKDAGKFVRNASRSIWTTHALMNRALDVHACKEERLQNRSPRKNLTPVKKSCLLKIYDDFCKRKLHGSERIKEASRCTYYLSVYINYLITSEVNKKPVVERRASSSSSDSSDDSSSDDST